MKTSALQLRILESLTGVAEGQALSFFEFPNPEGSLPFAISVGMRSGNKEVVGYGIGSTKDQAAFCATMELLERYLFQNKSDKIKYANHGAWIRKSTDVADISTRFQNTKNFIGPTSNGIAVHTNRNLAIQSAIDENIERHVVLKAMAKGISPAIIDPEPEVVAPFHFPNETLPTFFAWRGPMGRHVTLIRVDGEFGSIFGFGAHELLHESLRKAFFEVAPRLQLAVNHQLTSLVGLRNGPHFEANFGKSQLWTKRWLEGATSDEIPNIDFGLSNRDFWIADIAIPSSLKSLRKSIFAVQAISPLTQPLFHGDWSPDKINPAAIDNFVSPPDIHLVG